MFGGLNMAKTDSMALIDFQQRFYNEEACRLYLFKMRWPDGFGCSCCNHNEYYFIKTRKLYECKSCGHQSSLTAGTIMHKSKLSLQKWFWAIFLVVHDKRGRSALSLSGLLKLNYRTAWRLLHKIRYAMGERDAQYKLAGLIEMDDAYFGSPKKDKDGRGTEKAKVVISLSTDETGNPCYVRMHVVNNISTKEIQCVAENCIMKGSKILSDGQNSYKKLNQVEYEHIWKNYYEQIEAGTDFLKWIHVIISNAKAFIIGTYHGLGKDYLQVYLNEFCYRFNRRFFPDQLFGRLLNACISTKQIIKSPEVSA
jgi:transposase-like protein